MFPNLLPGLHSDVQVVEGVIQPCEERECERRMASGRHPCVRRLSTTGLDRPREGIWSASSGKLGHTGICGPQSGVLGFSEGVVDDPETVAAASRWSSCKWLCEDIGYQWCWQLSVSYHMPLSWTGLTLAMWQVFAQCVCVCVCVKKGFIHQQHQMDFFF